MKLAISVGDLSGELYGSHLVQELRRHQPNLELIGMGGESLSAAGVRTVCNLVPTSTVGFVEPLRYLFPILSAYFRMVRLLRQEKPNTLLLIDYQGFNMMLARKAKSMGIKTIYFIAPQEWLWGTQKGVKRVVETIDIIVAIFEKEYQAYHSARGNVVYFGHPLREMMEEPVPRSTFLSSLRLQGDAQLVAIFPGSRPHEIRRHVPIALDVVRQLSPSFPHITWVAALPHEPDRDYFQAECGRRNLQGPVKVTASSRDLMAHSLFGFGKPGTVLMEAILCGTPYLAFYKVSPLTYFIARTILKIRVPFYTMPNLLAGKQIIPELIQNQATPERIAENIEKWLSDPHLLEEVRAKYQPLRESLRGDQVLTQTAQMILGVLQN